ncbi:MAG TPA: hypothetical protein VJU16_07820 [Planctomycetota bacterium]|nr:hypothetical protein [Planctomycetota bacterium]
MTGDDRVRYCSDCKLNVYNFSGMTRREVSELIQLEEGRLCVRFYRRKDGTLVTRDCPVRWTWTGALARMAVLFLGLSVPFWGTVIVLNWRDLQAVMYGGRDSHPRRIEVVGVMIPAPPQPLGILIQPDTDRTEVAPEDTPPSHGPREAR